MTTLAVARFLAAELVGSQRVVIPLSASVVLLAFLFSGDPGPLPTPWAASALALYPIATWLGIVMADTEDPVQRTITVAAAGGLSRITAGTLLVALVADLLLIVLSLLWPVITTPYPHPRNCCSWAPAPTSPARRPGPRSDCCAPDRSSSRSAGHYSPRSRSSS